MKVWRLRGKGKRLRICEALVQILEINLWLVVLLAGCEHEAGHGYYLLSVLNRRGGGVGGVCAALFARRRGRNWGRIPRY